MMQAETLKAIKATFLEVNVNGDAVLSFDELARLLKKGDPNMTDAEIGLLFRAIDLDGEGSINFDEFVNYVFTPSFTPLGLPESGTSSTSTHVCSPENPAYVAALQREFPFKAYIEDTSCRGITVAQLARVFEYVVEHCEEWVDTATARRSKTAGQRLSMDFVNLYHINAWVILPSTMKMDCAFVELVAFHPQSPVWFISHWWGEPIQDLFACVTEHCKMRNLPEDTPYWICAYANRQHSLGQEVTADPRKSSFYKAMNRAVGILLILDKKTEHSGPATPFERIWCDFELSTATTGLDRDGCMLLDIATCTGSSAELLTDGFVPWDIRIKAGVDVRELRKAGREESFPLDVIKMGLAVEIQSGKASMPQDARAILNSITERRLTARPLMEHKNYDCINKKLRALFAIAVAPQAAKRGIVTDLRVLQTIAEDKWRKNLSLSLDRWEVLQDTEMIGRSLGNCSALTSLNLSLRACEQLRNIDGLGHLSRLTKLRELRLDLGLCSNLLSISSLQGVLRKLTHLASPEFDLTASTHMDALDEEVGMVLTHSRKLKRLTLILAQCASMTSAKELGHGVQQHARLVNLELNFRDCIQLTSPNDSIGKPLSRLTQLMNLKLIFSGCRQLTHVEDLGDSIARLTKLATLKLRFDSTPIASIDKLDQGIARLTNLQHFKLILQNCKHLTSLGELGNSLGQLTNLTELGLDLSRCISLASIEDIGKGFERLTKLAALHLNMCACERLMSIDALIAGLAGLRNITQLFLDFEQTGQEIPDEFQKEFKSLSDLFAAVEVVQMSHH